MESHSFIDRSTSRPAQPGRRSTAAAREAREARCTQKLFSLLEKREELRGVYAPADQIAETLRWSA